MGWGSGATLMYGIIQRVRPHMPDDARKSLYLAIIPEFEEMDWDTQRDCMGEDPMFDEALKKLHPSWFEDDES